MEVAPPPPRKPQRAGSHSSLRRLGVWLAVGGVVAGTLNSLAVANMTGPALRNYGIVGIAIAALAGLAVLLGPVLIVIGWVMDARGRSAWLRFLVLMVVCPLWPSSRAWWRG